MKKHQAINTDLITVSQGHKKLCHQIQRRFQKIPPDKAQFKEVKAKQDWEHNESLC